MTLANPKKPQSKPSRSLRGHEDQSASKVASHALIGPSYMATQGHVQLSRWIIITRLEVLFWITRTCENSTDYYPHNCILPGCTNFYPCVLNDSGDIYWVAYTAANNPAHIPSQFYNTHTLLIVAAMKHVVNTFPVKGVNLDVMHGFSNVMHSNLNCLDSPLTGNA